VPAILYLLFALFWGYWAGKMWWVANYRAKRLNEPIVTTSIYLISIVLWVMSSVGVYFLVMPLVNAIR
jgi:hypothetical protein